MEETGTDLIEVEDVPGEVEETLGADRRKEDDLSSKPLTEKMIYLMQKISEYGYLTRPEVELIYANQTHGYKVLAALRSKGMIGDLETERQPKKAVFLKPKGYRTLEKFGRLRLNRRFLPQQFKPFIFEHRLACARVGLVLEGHALVKEFMPESLLWERAVQRRQKLCDGEFLYKAPDAGAERVGLEVELTLKNRDKLDESLRALADRQDLTQVWWICGDATILRALKMEVLRGYRDAAPRHLFCLMADFMSLRHQVRLMDAEGASFKIDPAAPTLRPLPPRLPKPEPAAAVAAAAESHAVVAEGRYDRELRIEREKQLLEAEAERRRQQEEAEKRERRQQMVRRATVVATTVGVLALTAGARIAWKNLSVIFGDGPQAATGGRSERPWLARKILNAQEIAALPGTWVVKRVSLHSRGDRYRLSLKLLNPDGFWCGLMGVKVMDADRQVLGKLKIRGGDWIYAQHIWEGGLAFKAPRDETRVLLDLESSGWDCGNMEIPVVYNQEPKSGRIALP